MLPYSHIFPFVSASICPHQNGHNSRTALRTNLHETVRTFPVPNLCRRSGRACVCAGLCAGVWASSDRLYRRMRRSAERSGARRCSACRAYHRVAHTHAHRHAHTHLNMCEIAPSAIRPHDQFTRQPNPYLEKNQTQNRTQSTTHHPSRYGQHHNHHSTNVNSIVNHYNTSIHEPNEFL